MLESSVLVVKQKGLNVYATVALEQQVCESNVGRDAGKNCSQQQAKLPKPFSQ